MTQTKVCGCVQFVKIVLPNQNGILKLITVGGGVRDKFQLQLIAWQWQVKNFMKELVKLLQLPGFVELLLLPILMVVKINQMMAKVEMVVMVEPMVVALLVLLLHPKVQQYHLQLVL